MNKKEIIETSLNMPVTPEFIERRIVLIRGQKVILDSVLAELYQVETKNLIKAVKRNIERFPADFVFQINKEEVLNLRFQIGTSSWGGRRYQPYVFTELGVAMLSSVLKSDRAVQMNIFIMRAFVQLRRMLATNKALAGKVESLEKEQKRQGKDIDEVIIVVNKLSEAHRQKKSAIGFVVDKKIDPSLDYRPNKRLRASIRQAEKGYREGKLPKGVGSVEKLMAELNS